MPDDHSPVTLDGSSLTIEDLVRVARDPRIKVACAPDALKRVARGWQQIEQLVADYQAALAADQPLPRVYGVTTGFGEFKHARIDPAHFEQMQRNILLSHAVGAGDNADHDDLVNYFPAEVVRAALVLRLNAFLKGHSGVRPALVECVERMINRGIVPLVPTRGSLGASGDLCPLAHLFVVLLGEGRYYIANRPEDLAAGAAQRREMRRAGEHLADDLGFAAPPRPSFKEGLALTNGATFSAAMLALAVHDAERLASTADVAAKPAKPSSDFPSNCASSTPRTRVMDELTNEMRLSAPVTNTPSATASRMACERLASTCSLRSINPSRSA